MDELKSIAKSEGITGLPRMAVYQPGAGQLALLDVPFSKVGGGEAEGQGGREGGRQGEGGGGGGGTEGCKGGREAARCCWRCMRLLRVCVPACGRAAPDLQRMSCAWGRASPGNPSAVCVPPGGSLAPPQVKFLKTNLNVIAGNPGMAFGVDPNGWVRRSTVGWRMCV